VVPLGAEQSSQNIAIRISLERGKVLRALTIIRRALIRDVPEIFSETVEVDEIYLGGQWKNKRKIIRDAGTKQGRGTKRKLVFGILCRNGTVWGEVVNDVEAGNTSTTHHSAGHARFRRLFRYLESLYGNRIPGICSPSGESWRETVTATEKEIISMALRIWDI